MLDGRQSDAMAAASAVEMIQQFHIGTLMTSWIMYEMRHGVPTTHKKFDMPLAILAGDVLVFYSANTTGNVRFARGVAVGYSGNKVPGANLDVNGNAYISGSVSLGTALTVGSGGTGATSLTDGGVVTW